MATLDSMHIMERWIGRDWRDWIGAFMVWMAQPCLTASVSLQAVPDGGLRPIYGTLREAARFLLGDGTDQRHHAPAGASSGRPMDAGRERPGNGGVQGGEAFATAFAEGARRDQEGHSLKDLNLKRRLFENRCSYLIYSDNFRALPAPLKGRIHDMLARALRRTEPDARYYYLRYTERARIVKILRETLEDLPEGWLPDD